MFAHSRWAAPIGLMFSTRWACGTFSFNSHQFSSAFSSKKLRKITKNFELYIAGNIDSQNPSSVSLEEIKSWEAFDYLNYLGHINDMNELYKKIHVAVLPSYREGLPKGLLEAAACGKPIITTDVTGCRDVVENEKNGRTAITPSSRSINPPWPGIR